MISRRAAWRPAIDQRADGSTRRRRARALIQCLTLATMFSASAAEDWPQFLGPDRNGVYGGNVADLKLNWAPEGPKILWRKEVGEGFSGPVVSGETLILFHRLGAREVVENLDPLSGEARWTHSYPTSYRDDFGFDEGPRATPAIAGGNVYTMGAQGRVLCLSAETGAVRWSLDAKEQFSAPKGFFGMVCSPLVDGRRVYLNIGGAEGAGIVALDRETGDLGWKATSDEASYSSPVLAGWPEETLIFFTRSGLAGVRPESGEVRFRYPWRSRMNASVNAAAPLVIGPFIFLSASYQTGAILLKFEDGELAKVWSGDNQLSNHYATSVHHEGRLYGFHGRQEYSPSFRCVELKTGKVLWSEDRFGGGTVTRAGDRLLIMRETGELLIAAADPSAFDIQSRAHVLPLEVRAHPALAGGVFYARSKSQLAAIDLRRLK